MKEMAKEREKFTMNPLSPEGDNDHCHLFFGKFLVIN